MAKPTVVVGTAFSLKELAAELHVPRQTLYDLRSRGRGPRGFRVGRELRFRRSEIQMWLEWLEAEDAHCYQDPGPARRTAGPAPTSVRTAASAPSPPLGAATRHTRFRDADGRLREVTATGRS